LTIDYQLSTSLEVTRATLPGFESLAAKPRLGA
jgi:hypothetical protein